MRQPPAKKHSTDRYRGGTIFVESKTNAWAAKIGYLHGRGHGSPAISTFLNDGTSASTIRSMLGKWGLQDVGAGRRNVFIPVKLMVHERSAIQALANKRGMQTSDWMRKVIVSAAIPEDLFAAIVPEDD